MKIQTLRNSRPSSSPHTPAELRRVRQVLTQAVASALADPHLAGARHPALQRFGARLGLALGVIVTETLAVLPAANRRLTTPSGAPTPAIWGAQRIDGHDLRARHEAIIGPKILKLIDRLPPSALRELVAAFGAGASVAPGASYRLEAGGSSK